MDVLNQLEKLFPYERFQRHFTMTYIVLHAASGRMLYASAGHPPPILQRKNGEIRLLDTGGPVVGLGDILAHEEAEVELAHGDRVFLYTDGIVEHHNGNREAFGVENLVGSISAAATKPIQAVCPQVIDDVEAHGGRARFVDDVSLLAFEFRSAAGCLPQATDDKGGLK